MPDSDFVAGLFVRDDDEGLFSRDINGQLVRLDAPTESDYEKNVTLQIDGVPVTVPLAEPLTDANGNIVRRSGRTHDAALHDDLRCGAEALRRANRRRRENPDPGFVPSAAHDAGGGLPVCIVQIYGQKRGRRAAERKLLPACQHQVKDGMEVFTMNAPGPMAIASGKQ